MNTIYIKKGSPLIFCGYKIKAEEIRKCLLTLTDLYGALHAFSVRVIKSERPRKKLIIDVEMAPGFDPSRYDENQYLYELIAKLKKASRNFREYMRNVPNDAFPEFHLFSFRNLVFDPVIYSVKNYYLL